MQVQISHIRWLLFVIELKFWNNGAATLTDEFESYISIAVLEFGWQQCHVLAHA